MPRSILDFLVVAPAGTPVEGKLVTNPSYSPENSFILPNGKCAEFTYGATIDLMIINDLLTNCIEASKTLDIDPEFRKECESALRVWRQSESAPGPGAFSNGSKTTRKPSRTTVTLRICMASSPAT